MPVLFGQNVTYGLNGSVAMAYLPVPSAIVGLPRADKNTCTTKL
jgi:hypothetical protein